MASLHVVAIVQARLGSVRLPDKVLSLALGEPMIGHLLSRLCRAVTIDEIVLAIPDTAPNDPLADWAERAGHNVFRGDEHDVLDRYFRAAREARADVVVRITGDCPLVDPVVVDRVVERFLDGDVDYVGISDPPTFPDGLDAEAFSMAALETAWTEAHLAYDREHVTPYLRTQPRFRRWNVAHDVDLSNRRWTLDEPEDLEVIRSVFEHFGHDRFGFSEVVELEDSAPRLFAANAAIGRDEGSALGTGAKLWKRAKRVIPGGNMLLSKRPEMLLPESWPTYFSRAQGCRVWDLDDNEFLDLSLMGVGTNILGYGHPKVDEAVARVVRDGNLSTLNAPEEVLLAEELVGLHPWAEMARFTRSGGEACAVAVRIARAASGRSAVAFCGYHGWHDWYLAANLDARDALVGHHLPGLEPRGVPPTLVGTALPFAYNDLETLERIVREHDVGVIFMEVERSTPPEPGFLESVRLLATNHDIVLVFDECTSGFRKVVGGLHLSYGIDPDVAIFGKTLGNGYAVNAIVGRRSVMESAQDTFISSTFWTERIGSAAALAALSVMRDEDAPARIDAVGNSVMDQWREIASDAGVSCEISGLPALASMTFPGSNHLAYKTLIAQEFLKRGYLATTSLYASIAHSDEILDGYFCHLAEIFELIGACENGASIDAMLEGPICHPGFSRLA